MKTRATRTKRGATHSSIRHPHRQERRFGGDHSRAASRYTGTLLYHLRDAKAWGRRLSDMHALDPDLKSGRSWRAQ